MRLVTRSLVAFLLIGLLGLTAWIQTRSDALAKAQLAYNQADLLHCLQHALDHLERQPWSSEAALLAARCLSRLDYADAAEPYYRRAGKLSLNDSQIRAYGMARGPHPDQAIAAYRAILEVAPENITALRRLAAILLAQKKTDDILKLADRLAKLPDGAVIGTTLRGVAYHNDNNPQQAVAAFKDVLKLDPELKEMPLARSLFWSHLVDDLIASGRMEDADRSLTQALENASDASLMNRLGMIYFLRGELDDAERSFRRAAEWDPSSFDPPMNLAKVALQRGRPHEALEQLNRAKLLAPRQYPVYYNLASVYRQLGQTAEADRIQATLKQFRQRQTPASTASVLPAASGTWPRYALSRNTRF